MKKYFKLFILILVLFNFYIVFITLQIFKSSPINSKIEKASDLKFKIVRSKYQVKCNLLFEMNSGEIDKAKKMLKNNKLKLIPDENFIFDRLMCPTYKTLFNEELNEIKVTQNELNFPLAFAILTYQHVEQIHRLLRLIYRPQNFYCIHIDTKSSREYRRAIESIASCFDNIIIAAKSENITWAGFGILQAELNCMQDLLKKSQKWKYLIHMSGNEMPLKTNYELVKILNVYNGTNDVEIVNDFHSRYKYKYILDSQHILKRTNQTMSPPPHNYSIVKGTTNSALSREFVKYVFKNRKVRDLIEWSKDMYVPDEMYFLILFDYYF